MKWLLSRGRRSGGVTLLRKPGVPSRTSLSRQLLKFPARLRAETFVRMTFDVADNIAMFADDVSARVVYCNKFAVAVRKSASANRIRSNGDYQYPPGTSPS